MGDDGGKKNMSFVNSPEKTEVSEPGGCPSGKVRTGDGTFQPDNTSALRHGAFSEKVSLSERNEAILRNGITYLSSLPGVQTAYIPILQRIERVWLLLMKLDEWEDKFPEKIDHKHFGFKSTYENTFRLNLNMLFELTGNKAIKKFSRDFAKELSEASDDNRPEQSKN